MNFIKKESEYLLSARDAETQQKVDNSRWNNLRMYHVLISDDVKELYLDRDHVMDRSMKPKRNKIFWPESKDIRALKTV